MNESGALEARLVVPAFSSFAVSARSGRLFVATATSGSLISVYARDGKLLARFGVLKSFADLYGGTGLGSRDGEDLSFLNKVYLAPMPDGGVIATYRFAPLVERYGSTGELLWQRRLVGPAIDELTEMFLDDSDAPGEKYVRVRSAGGRTANFVTMSGSYDPASRRIYVLLPNQEVATLDQEGRQRETIQLTGPTAGGAAPFALSLVVGRPGELLLFNPLSQEVWRARLDDPRPASSLHGPPAQHRNSLSGDAAPFRRPNHPTRKERS